MKTVAISAFDSGFFNYALRMYTSLRAWHPDLPMYAGDLGLQPRQVELLESMGVKVLQTQRSHVLHHNHLRLCFGDFLLHSFLVNNSIAFDKVLWIDADTLILKPINLAWELQADVVGHPGRHAGGPIWTMGERWKLFPGTCHREELKAIGIDWPSDAAPYIATGLWCTSSKPFLKVLDESLDKLFGLTDDSPVFSAIADAYDLDVFQLEPETWNFSRQMVATADYRHGEIRSPASIYKPYTAGFSLCDDGKRGTSKALDDFYLIECLPRALVHNGDSQMNIGKLQTLAQFALDRSHQGPLGPIVECGVWRGASAAVIGHAFKHQQTAMYLFDSFEGMPAPTAQDMTQGDLSVPGRVAGDGGSFGKGSLADTSIAHVAKVVERAELKHVHAFKGMIKSPQDLKEAPEFIAFLHVDLDFYEPYKVALDTLYPRVLPGGAIVFDDYGHFIGAKRAIDEFVSRTGEKLLDIDGTSRRVVIKGQR